MTCTRVDDFNSVGCSPQVSRIPWDGFDATAEDPLVWWTLGQWWRLEVFLDHDLIVNHVISTRGDAHPSKSMIADTTTAVILGIEMRGGFEWFAAIVLNMAP